MEPEHWIGRISVRALITRGRDIFVCRGTGDALWQLPGGRMRKKEEPASALKREIEEELGVNVQIISPLYIQTFTHTKSGTQQLVVVYLCSLGGSVVAADPQEIEEVRWVRLNEIASLPMFADCRNAIREFVHRTIAEAA